MKKPKLIAFDYGQTLLDEGRPDGERGSAAVLAHARSNPHGYTPRQIQDMADQLNRDIGRPSTGNLLLLEVPNFSFQQYLYECLDIEFDLTSTEVERLFWDAASPPQPTPFIEELLEGLHRLGIRTGVFSNLSMSGASLRQRLDRHLPRHRFEFILASSEYVFRKPHRRAFELVLNKARLPAEDVWYCGDNVVCDIEGASALGIFPVWYRGASQHRGAPPTVPHLAVDDWRDLLRRLEE